MKEKIFKAISILATSSNAMAPAAALSHTMTDPAEIVAYQNAVASGSPADIQVFLAMYPGSTLVGTAFGQLMQQIQPKVPRESAGTASILRVQYDVPPPTVAPPPVEKAPPVEKGRVSVTQAQRTVESVERASGRLQSDISRCERDSPVQVNNCVGLALSYYGNSLSSPRVALPPQLKSIPRLVVRTARTVRAARTTQAARQAVDQAIAEIRKQIKLLQVADDSQAGKLQVRAGNLVAASLTSAGEELRQVEL